MNWYWGAGIVMAVLFVLWSRRGEGSDSRRLRSGNDPATAERVDEFIRAGRKIEAIKEYRMLHGVGLKEAKEAVEVRERELGR